MFQPINVIKRKTEFACWHVILLHREHNKQLVNETQRESNNNGFLTCKLMKRGFYQGNVFDLVVRDNMCGRFKEGNWAKLSLLSLVHQSNGGIRLLR